MSESASFGSPVDNVRRDIKDGAYHCPQCDTPFTRRSNLRRHFQIHMRSAILKCDNCSEEFSAKEDLQSHAPSCYSWSTVHDKTLRDMERPYSKNSSESTLTTGHSRQMSQPFDGRNGSYAAPPFPNFESPETRYLGNGNYHAGDFSQVMPLSSSGSGVPPTPPLSSSFDGNYVNPSSTTPSNVFSHRRPSISSSNSSSSASSSPYTQPPAHLQAINYGYYGSTDNNMLFNGPQAQARPGEKLYTRRQVKDMIDVVSECLIESMESVLARPPTIAGTIQLDSPDGQMIRPHAGRDEGFRQTLLSEAIPRAYYRMHSGGSNPKV